MVSLFVLCCLSVSATWALVFGPVFLGFLGIFESLGLDLLDFWFPGF